MTIHDAVANVSGRFAYLADTLRWFDSWRVMPGAAQPRTVLRGDCEDFALTVYWLLCGRSLWRFLWRVLVTHEYGLHRCITMAGEAHVVGVHRGLWFDNFTYRALPKAEFLESTGHRLQWRYPGPVIAVYLFIGLVRRRA